MDQEFSKKTLLVTGATSGIGKATALRFARDGDSIAAIGRNEAALVELKKELDSFGIRSLDIRADLSLEVEAAMTVSRTMEHFDGVDVLVNAAGHISSGTIEDTSLEAWDAMFEINLRAPFRLMQKALP